MNYQEEFKIALKFLRELKQKHYAHTTNSDVDMFLKKHEKRRWGVFETVNVNGHVPKSPFCIVECYSESGDIAEQGIIVGKFVKWVD